MSTQSISLHYETAGTGKPLILLHGLFGSSSNWRPMAKQWSEKYQVFAVDLRNHGRSPHSDTMNYGVMADDVRSFMQSQNIASTFLLGHSMGGKTAMQFALNYPDLVDKLVVVDMPPHATLPRHGEILAALGQLNLQAAANRRELDAELAQDISDASVRQFLLMNIMNDQDGKLVWRMNLESLTRNYDQINRAVESAQIFEKPTLFIRGEKSDYITDEHWDNIKTLFPSAEIVTVAGAGHWVHAEAPQEFSRVVQDFLLADR